MNNVYVVSSKAIFTMKIKNGIIFLKIYLFFYYCICRKIKFTPHIREKTNNLGAPNKSKYFFTKFIIGADLLSIEFLQLVIRLTSSGEYAPPKPRGMRTLFLF